MFFFREGLVGFCLFFSRIVVAFGCLFAFCGCFFPDTGVFFPNYLFGVVKWEFEFRCPTLSHMDSI